MRKKICFFLIIFCLGFIWVNSLLPAELSGAMSGLVTQIFGDPSEGTGIAEGVIRKLAHGFEYAMLGTFMTVYAYEAIVKRLPIIGFSGLMTAVIDETIQLFSAGRSSQIGDVWIDFAGFAAGTALVLLIKWIRGRFQGKISTL